MTSVIWHLTFCQILKIMKFCQKVKCHKMIFWCLLFTNFLYIFRFCVGDRFFLCDNKILCEYDYEERMVFANLAYNSSNLASQMKSNNRSNNGPANGPSAAGPNATPVSSATGLKVSAILLLRCYPYIPKNFPP